MLLHEYSKYSKHRFLKCPRTYFSHYFGYLHIEHGSLEACRVYHNLFQLNDWTNWKMLNVISLFKMTQLMNDNIIVRMQCIDL